MSLKTDYQNDILDTSVNTHRRYAVKNNSDDTVIHDDVYLEDITTYTQKGTSFGAEDINAVNKALTDHDFTITTTWSDNTTYGDYSTYPYYQSIASDLFTDESHPDCLVFGADPSAFMTSDEDSAKGLMCGEVSFSASGIIVLAMSATETPLTLRVRGV